MSLHFVRTAASTVLFLHGAASAQTSFEVASIKPNRSTSTMMKFPFPSGGRFTGTNLTLKTLISFGYGVQGFAIEGTLGFDRYDIEARAAGTTYTPGQYREMLRSLLVDRFKLAVHRETKDSPMYAILPAQNGPRVPETKEGSCVDGNLPRQPQIPGQETPVVCGTFFTGPASLDVRKMSMAQIAGTLSIVLGRPVIDKKALTGAYDFHLEFAPEGTGLVPGRGQQLDTTAAEDSRPSIFTALQQQLGLRLESGKAPLEVLVIDHVEHVPTPN